MPTPDDKSERLTRLILVSDESSSEWQLPQFFKPSVFAGTDQTILAAKNLLEKILSLRDRSVLRASI
jgi:hypothetical protein